ncbi:M23 family metallopeptidase [Streptomyces lunalinharesii]|uniref:M23 family metallopeptidase n=1 Tax=Streptomyces lunalinharesii TaxID=333384 RepID=A0ABN3RYU5_9ACTN
MDDRHPSGAQLPTAPASDASYAPSAYGDDDPLFGAHPGGYGHGSYDTAGHPTDAYPSGSYPTAGYDGTGYDTGYGSTGYDPYAHTGHDAPGYDTGATGYADAGYGTDYDSATYGLGGGYDAAAHHGGTAYDPGTYDPGTHAPAAYANGGYDNGAYSTGSYDAGSYDTAGYPTQGFATDGFDGGAYGSGGYDTGAAYGTGDGLTGGYGTGSYAPTGHDAGGYNTGYQAAGYDSAAFAAAATTVQQPVGHEATAVWSTTDYADYATDRTPDPAPGIPAQAGPPPEDTLLWDAPLMAHAAGTDDPDGPSDTGASATGSAAIADAMTQAMPVTVVPDDDAPTGRRVSGPPAGKAVRGGNRGRRRQAKRSALLTVAVPSVAAMGVCAAAAASVSQFGGDDQDGKTTQAAPDAGATTRTTAANKKLDSQLAGLSASAQDFRERASRTQERLDLKQRQADERKRKEEEAARKEALRPKFVLPVTQHGLSALFGQAGVNWMSVHTGIDFPVSYGTTVMAATDGTIHTQWNSAYGNMAILTAPDGTETWYCHLSSTKIRSGSVKAGDAIAYSGSSGNSTGPHLHFEVRPGGGAAVDPLPWLRAHGLNPN